MGDQNENFHTKNGWKVTSASSLRLKTGIIWLRWGFFKALSLVFILISKHKLSRIALFRIFKDIYFRENREVHAIKEKHSNKKRKFLTYQESVNFFHAVLRCLSNYNFFSLNMYIDCLNFTRPPWIKMTSNQREKIQ